MANFTIRLKDVIEMVGGTVERENGRTKLIGVDIGLDHYPIYTEDYRDTLNGLIVDHYWNREIGLETIDMFQLAMRRKMNEIMPLYNQLYLSTLENIEPLSTVNIISTSVGRGSQEGSSEAESVATSLALGKSRTVNGETPQTQLAGNADYATALVDSNSTSDSDSTGSQVSNETQLSESETESRTTGYQGAASDLIMRYRESLINVDLMVIRELEECFMLVWDTAHSYTKGYTL